MLQQSYTTNIQAKSNQLELKQPSPSVPTATATALHDILTIDTEAAQHSHPIRQQIYQQKSPALDSLASKLSACLQPPSRPTLNLRFKNLQACKDPTRYKPTAHSKQHSPSLHHSTIQRQIQPTACPTSRPNPSRPCCPRLPQLIYHSEIQLPHFRQRTRYFGYHSFVKHQANPLLLPHFCQ